MKAILIAEDDATIKVTADAAQCRPHRHRALPHGREKQPERTLMLGWNRRGPMIAFELSAAMSRPARVLTIAADTPELAGEVARAQISGSNLAGRIRRRRHQPAARRSMALNIPSYDHVLVLGYSDQWTPSRPTPARW